MATCFRLILLILVSFVESVAPRQVLTTHQVPTTHRGLRRDNAESNTAQHSSSDTVSAANDPLKGGDGGTLPGATASEKIIKGMAADFKKYRYFARLTYTHEETLENRCGGVLISDRFVLTAASCVWHFGPGGLRPDFFGAAVGLVCDGVDNCGFPFVSFKATNVWVHPAWNPTRHLLDIAFFRLAAPVPSAVAVPAEPDLGDYYRGLSFGYADNLRSIGYGVVNDARGLPSALQELAVGFMPTLQCEAIWGQLFNAVVCIYTDDAEEGLYGRGICFGDSGSPTVIPRVDSPDVVVGVASFGSTPCESKSRPDALARVSAGTVGIANVVCYPGMSDVLPEWCLRLGWNSTGSEPIDPGSLPAGVPEPAVVVVDESEKSDKGKEKEGSNKSPSEDDKEVEEKCEGDHPRYHPNTSKKKNTKSCRKLREKRIPKIKKACSKSTSDAVRKCCFTCDFVLNI